MRTLIQGGQLYDGGGGPPVQADVRLDAHQILEVAPNLAPGRDETFDAHGMIVAPGLIDLHVHVFDGTGVYSVNVACAGLSTGVTTMLDTGSAGALTYRTFHKYIIPPAEEDVFALLNISQIGVQGYAKIEPFLGDLHNIRYLHIPSAVECIEDHRDRILGTKVRLTAALAERRVENEYAGMHGAVEAARRTGLRCMVHHSASSIPQPEMLAALGPGDIVTHTYHGKGDGGFAKPDGTPSEAMHKARDQGILFDVGHGVGSFDWSVAEPACQAHGFWPDTISTDLHQFNVQGPVFDMTTTMTKFLHLGMPLEKVIQASTANPAAAMGFAEQRGRIRTGMLPDITLLRLVDERVELTDAMGQVRVGNQRLVPLAVFKRGRRVDCVRGNESALPTR